MRDQDRIEKAISYVVKAAVLLSEPTGPAPVIEGPTFENVAGEATRAIASVLAAVEDENNNSQEVHVVGSRVVLYPAAKMDAQEAKLILEARITKVVRDAIGKAFEESGAL